LGGLCLKAKPQQIVHETPISKIIRAKWTGDVTQVVECMLCKYKALSSNPSPIMKIKKIYNKENIIPPSPFVFSISFVDNLELTARKEKLRPFQLGLSSIYLEQTVSSFIFYFLSPCEETD
jgi:hypothetical protein